MKGLAPFRKGVQAIPKLKTNHQDVSKGEKSNQADEAIATQQKDEPSQKENSPPAAGMRKNAVREPRTTKKPSGACRNRGPSATAAANTRATVLAEVQPPAAEEVNPPPSSTEKIEAAPQASDGARAGKTLRTGDEVWQLNLMLGSIAETLADPEDSKKRRGRKSPTLQEQLHKAWGGRTYAQKIEHELASQPQEEEAPSYKYVPPNIRDEPSDCEGDGGDLVSAPAAEKPPGAKSQAPQGKASSRPPSPSNAAADRQAEDPGPSAAEAKPAAKAKAPARGGGRKAVGKAGARAPADVDGAEAAVTVAPGAEEREEADDTRDRAVERPAVDMDVDDVGEAGPGPSTEALRREEDQKAEQKQQQRRGGRKAGAAAAAPAAAAAAEKQAPAAKAPPAVKAAARRSPRRSARKAQPATAEIDDDELGFGTATAPAATPASAAQPPPSASAPPMSTRGRKTHLPLGVAFGQGTSRPQNQLETILDGCVAGSTAEPAAGPGPGVGTTTAMAQKRAREGLAGTEHAGRPVKVLRLDDQYQQEQQQAQMEALRQRIKDLEQKNKEKDDLLKQKDAALKAAERKCTQLELDLEAAKEKEKERLKSGRDAKVSDLKEELQAKTRELKAKTDKVAALQSVCADAMRLLQKGVDAA